MEHQIDKLFRSNGRSIHPQIQAQAVILLLRAPFHGPVDRHPPRPYQALDLPAGPASGAGQYLIQSVHAVLPLSFFAYFIISGPACT